MRALIRIIGFPVGLVLLFAGAMGLVWAHLPDSPLGPALEGLLTSSGALLNGVGVPLPEGHALVRSAHSMLGETMLGYVSSVLGLGLLIFAFLPGGKKIDPEAAFEGPLPTDKKQLKKIQKQAAGLARKGETLEAAELLRGHELFDDAAKLYIDAGEFVRAAEIRHDQNHFIESAELYERGEKLDAAASIYAQQEEFSRAAACYRKAGNLSSAGEMYDLAGEHQEAADCYREVEFLRHAAKSYVKAKKWALAASCLAEEFADESRKGGANDAKRESEIRNLAVQAAKLFQRAEDPEKACEILEKADCHIEAAELALKLHHFAKAAELFRDAGDLPSAAEALRSMGEQEEAARLLGEFHRDRGELKEAAACLEEAGDLLAAGDMHRTLEDYERAGSCYAQQGDLCQAAEMFGLAGDRLQAAQCYERAERFAEAAECYALAGKPEKEAELLERACAFLAAGEAYHREGMDEEAITVLQKVPPDSAGFGTASALLGDIFLARGQLSLAIKKLRQAIGDSELSQQNLPAYYTLATVCESNDEVAEAVEIYEKIMTFDYHYEDVEQRLIEAREVLKMRPPLDSASTPQGSTGRTVAATAQPGRYQVVGELGRGGMGIVYKAKDTVLDRVVAYKVLPDTLAENQQALGNFLREAKAAAKLNHPNIVTVYDTGEQDGRYFIAMEYVDGTTLKEILRRRGVIAPAGIFHVLAQVCEALAYAHENKVVHRDIKSANTMWTRDKKAKIMDFGLAKVVEEVRNHTTVVAGTPYYMSPEQTLGKNVDHRTDIYSLGATVFEMATGTVPFKEGNIPYHHVHTPPPDIRELRPELPESLAQIVACCLQKDPAQRYQSTREILAELRNVLRSPASS